MGNGFIVKIIIIFIQLRVGGIMLVNILVNKGRMKFVGFIQMVGCEDNS